MIALVIEWIHVLKNNLLLSLTTAFLWDVFIFRSALPWLVAMSSYRLNPPDYQIPLF